MLKYIFNYFFVRYFFLSVPGYVSFSPPLHLSLPSPLPSALLPPRVSVAAGDSSIDVSGVFSH